MRNYIALFPICWLALLCAAQEKPSISPESVTSALAKLDPYNRSSLASTKVPGVAVAVVYNDQVVFLRGYGIRKVGESAQVDPDTVFECKAPLPSPQRRGERLCDRCGGVGKKRVYMHFMFRKGWLRQFLQDDLKTPLPRKVLFEDDKKIWEMAKSGGFTLNISGRREIEEAIRRRRGGIIHLLSR